MSPRWLIPWTRRGPSGALSDNLLWNDDRLYVMDNHRLALWCWWQHLSAAKKWGFLHVDRHFDALWSTAAPWKKRMVAQHRADLDAFRNATWAPRGERHAMSLYRWDTITSALWHLHANQLKTVEFATAGEGDDPHIPGERHLTPWQLYGQLEWYAEREESDRGPWIIDVDLDYFTEKDRGTGAIQDVIADEYVRAIGRHLATGLGNGNFGVVTIALSPETTGSWEIAEHYLDLLLEGHPTYGHLQAGRP